ncbi:Gfo/Idh/MocA family oxidoreductase [Sphaerospermopsis aphanizomenoides BCCUSP55]|uniref:Gfo/Idh/MocA family protein n=1 Tax=Sphaerospermopsis aphanizomenoides TaxID=459663 RepID=UPI000B1D8F0D|nr:Gfo/Idh/MocA family oxidoreductase [Sphaerospermopsis aphanizomenoides]MBK1986503.1 Gfo/Idh/MocA family oxidoreductase [Sphaerospermopsis aphanizomenoides BCCUSP55]
MTSNLKNIRWGILGTGKIAQNFAFSLTEIESAVKHSVASRNPANAVNFSQKFGFANAHQTFEEFFSHPDIDVVYIATPTSLHHEHCLMALNSGKAILCEKPFTRSWEEAYQVVEQSRSRGLFCMEAMWMRFNPFIQECKQIIQQKHIGEVCSLNLGIGYQKDLAKLGQPEDGRGAMLVFGCYALNLAFFLFGEPQNYQCQVIRTDTGVDVNCAVILGYPNHTVSITASINGTQSNNVHIVGTDGSIHIPSPFIDPTEMQVFSSRSPKITITQRIGRKLERVAKPLTSLFPKYANPAKIGLTKEAEETMRCLRLGLIESPIMPLNESLAIHRLLDEIQSS